MPDFDQIFERLMGKTEPAYGLYNCVIWCGAKWHNGAYGVITNPFYHVDRPYIPKRIGVHRLSYIIRHREQYPDGILPSVDDEGRKLNVSHLCHNSLCVNPDHLTMETQAINNDRKSCKCSGRCLRTHNPFCLL